MAEEYIDIIIREFTQDGFVIYEDFETGLEITDPTLIEQVANLDGFTVLDGQAIWNDYIYTVYNPSVIVTGGDKYNETTNNVISVGTGNTISDYSNNINVFGNNNVLNDAPLNVFVNGSQVTTYESSDTTVLYNLTESRVVTQSFGSVLLNPIYDVGYYPAIASGSNIFTDKTGSVYLGNTIVQGTTEFRQGVNAFGDITLDGVSITTLLSGSADKKVGTFYDTTTQPALSTLIPYKMKFNTTDISNGVTVQGIEQSELTVTTAGNYNLQFSAQLFDNGGGNETVFIWFRKNGTDIPNSTTKITMKGGNDAVVAAWNYITNLNVGEYLEIMWAVSDTSISLLYQPPFPFCPAIPSVIATMTQI